MWDYCANPVWDDTPLSTELESSLQAWSGEGTERFKESLQGWLRLKVGLSSGLIAAARWHMKSRVWRAKSNTTTKLRTRSKGSRLRQRHNCRSVASCSYVGQSEPMLHCLRKRSGRVVPSVLLMLFTVGTCACSGTEGGRENCASGANGSSAQVILTLCAPTVSTAKTP
jgi:hypothetical protein